MNLFRAFMELDRLNEGIYDEPCGKFDNRSDWVPMKTGTPANLSTKSSSASPVASTQNTKKYALSTTNSVSLQNYDLLELEPDGLWLGGVANPQDLTTSTGLFNDESDAVKAAQFLFNFNLWQNDLFIVECDISAGTANIVQTVNKKNTSKYVVLIVNHGGRLRALATDGINPAAWVAFPNNLRQYEGQKYEVDQLIWNGKNYRVSGNIVAI